MSLQEKTTDSFSQVTDTNLLRGAESEFINLNPSNRYFDIIFQWHGKVIEIKDKSFICEFTDPNDSKFYEETEISMKDVNNSDLELVILGAKFIHCLRREYNPFCRYISDIRFQRFIPEYKTIPEAPTWMKELFNKDNICQEEFEKKDFESE